MKVILLLVLLCSTFGVALGGCGGTGKKANPPDSVVSPSPMLTAPVDVSKNPLADFVPDDLPLLKRHLATSSAWKLTREGTNLVAVRREKADETTPDAGKLRSTADGWYFKHQPWRRYRLRLGLGSAPAPPDAAWQAIRVEAEPGAREVVIKVQPVTHPDFRSYLVVPGDNDLFLEVLEESMDTSRDTTRRLVRAVNEELEKLLEWSQHEKPTATVPGLTPADSTTAALPVLRVEKASGAPGYHVYGYANPAAEGAVYVRLFDAAGTEIQPEAVRAETWEYTGWSSDPKVGFFFNSRLQAGNRAGPTRAELWFQPETGGTPRKLLTAKPG